MSEAGIIAELRKVGASVHRVENPNLLIVGYANENHMIAVQGDDQSKEFISRWKGRKVFSISSPKEALAVIGAGSVWLRWRLERDRVVMDAVREALRYKQGAVHAEDILRHQEEPILYTTARGLRRALVDLEQRGLLVRLSYTSGYILPRTH